jgi:hypothetical protein
LFVRRHRSTVPPPTTPADADEGPAAEPDPIALSRRYLRAARAGDGTGVAAAESSLAGLDGDRLAARLATDADRIAFWLNVYNAAVAARLRGSPESLGPLRRLVFFARPAVTVAGHPLSPNDVEHGLLRRSRLAVGLGYLPRLRPDEFERTHRVDGLDPRIHFALNCGAVACPAVLGYEPATLDETLRTATRTYLASEVSYDPATDRAVVPRLFLWYRGDFGGPDGIRAFCRAHDALPADAAPRLSYADYDWSLDPALRDGEADGTGTGTGDGSGGRS